MRNRAFLRGIPLLQGIPRPHTVPVSLSFLLVALLWSEPGSATHRTPAATAPVPPPSTTTPSVAPTTPAATGRSANASTARSAGRSASKRFVPLSSEERNARIVEGRAIPSIAERLEYLTRPFLNAPYLYSPLGEGDGARVDPGPRIRWDGFDCLTFIETAMAMARAESPEGLLSVLDDVRYASLPPSYLNRNHFSEAQWIPHNILKGYITDIAHEVAGSDLLQMTTSFGPERWDKQRRPDALALTRDDIPRGSFPLNVVPLSIARERIQRFPSGSLLFVVREDRDYEPTMITHVGIVFDGPQGKMLRHAAQRPYLRVIDERLEAFLWRNSRYTNRSVIGVALYEILDSAPATTTVSLE